MNLYEHGVKDMTSAERSLLLFLEARAVDHSGLIDVRHMNDMDNVIAERWDNIGFIVFGRVTMATLKQTGCPKWCRLSDEAWKLAHEERRARADRKWASRTWQTTEEKREHD